jgi:uncharacterized sporulation protein YeaH/YhbH (DUF444 family)
MEGSSTAFIVDADFRYRTPKPQPKDHSSADVVFLMDKSGSTFRVLNFLKKSAYLIDVWLAFNYSNVRTHYVNYDSDARQVSRDKFFSYPSGGENDIAAGLRETVKIFKSCATSDLFVVHLLDGDYTYFDRDGEMRVPVCDPYDNLLYDIKSLVWYFCS